MPAPRRPTRRRPGVPGGARRILGTRSTRRAALLPLIVAGTMAVSCGRTPRPTVVPLPAMVAMDAGASFAVTPQTRIAVVPADEATLRVARVLADLLGPTPAEMPAVVPGPVDDAAGAIHLLVAADAADGDEGYDLRITPDRVTLAAPSAAGLFYGVQTIRQLLPVIVEHEAARRGRDPLTLPAGHIRDTPRYAWRGAMLDVARHFLDVAAVERYIDLIALYKINRLHLHLTDDQGWRVDIPSWPNLTRHGGSTEVGGGPGGFYTQDQYAGIVAYARDRFITVVPEIDMPGHTNAALASYPELNCSGVAPPLYTGIQVGLSALCVEAGNTDTFIDDVIGALALMTPGPFIHIGGDEVKTLTDDQYRRFIERVQDIVHRHGKRMIGWDEVAAASLSPSSVVQHWRPGAASALVASAPAVILSPADRIYLDMKYDAATLLGLIWAGFIDVRQAYERDPSTHVPGLAPDRVLGVEAPLWSETIADIRDLEHMAFPRIAALAEVAWSPQASRGWDAFERRLAAHAPRWSALGVNFHRSRQVRWRD